MAWAKYLNRTIEFSFYILFFLVPLIFSSKTSELFEFNKMWLTFSFTIVIGTSWIIKMILEGKIKIQKTPLDIPILLFLISQTISTIFSLDPHISLWGYYSRFNGGLLSLISYLFLYYAFVSNFTAEKVLKILKISLLSGAIVALWGIPSHFGYDPTCFLFRGSLDTSCWTEAFKPEIRIFSTLGQPAWMAAYMALLIPIAIAFGITENKKQKSKNNWKLEIGNWKFLILSSLFYLALLYTGTRAGFLGFWIANFAFWAGSYFLLKKKIIKAFLISNALFLTITFFATTPFSQINQYATIDAFKNNQTLEVQTQPQTGTVLERGGTESGQIRQIVWKGAIDAWMANPLIGTGVETFAYAYYQYRPLEHNLTSEWDYLYNKAHNEYLNYLTTTGAFGLGSYIFIIGTFLFVAVKQIKKSKNNPSLVTYHLSLVASFLAILVTNFFGFSVVITNLYLFLIPAFFFILQDILKEDNNLKIKTPPKAIGVIIVILTGSYLLFSIFSYWAADTSYAAGSALNNTGSYQKGFTSLLQAQAIKPNEPVYKEELSQNVANLAAVVFLQNDAPTAATLADEAVKLNDEVVENHPNNVSFYKNRVRLYYTLAQGDEKNKDIYLNEARNAITKAAELAPTDAKISYNRAILIGQIGDTDEAINLLEETIRLKPDYRDAHYALGLFYDEKGETEKAVSVYEYVLKNINPNDEEVKEKLREWKK